ncbi:MAG: hypothetical protein QOI74_3075, partial [Micromonosporaceae bacterium]|nr:hypothetical protein [Micromonosporaceae bacterium]
GSRRRTLLPGTHNRGVVIPVTRTVQAQALFASCLQPSDRATPAALARAIRDSLRGHHGAAGCAAVVAAEYGDHPDMAAARMRWALAAVRAELPPARTVATAGATGGR